MIAMKYVAGENAFRIGPMIGIDPSALNPQTDAIEPMSAMIANVGMTAPSTPFDFTDLAMPRMTQKATKGMSVMSSRMGASGRISSPVTLPEWYEACTCGQLKNEPSMTYAEMSASVSTGTAMSSDRKDIWPRSLPQRYSFGLMGVVSMRSSVPSSRSFEIEPDET